MRKMSKWTLLLCCFAFCFSLTDCCRTETNPFPVPERAAGQTDVLQLRCDPIPVVRVAFVGVGMRGIEAVRRFMYLDGVEVKAVCDLSAEKVAKANEILERNNRPKADEYVGEEAWKELCERNDIELVYICTDWSTHTPIAVYAMEQGKHAAIEVPAATTVADCWRLVDTAEKTRRHCMMLENCCYDFFELTTLNMAQQGFFGELVHGEGAYIHDLRFLNFDEETGYENMWRLKENTEHTGNLYPTHGLGPICQIFNIHRGDRMATLVSMSSDQFGMKAYAEEKGLSERLGDDFMEGDMNTTVIKTAKGKTIMIQHDVTSPRPYRRIHLVSGTKAYACKYPNPCIAVEPNAHSVVTPAQFDSLMQVYEHPFIKEIGEKAREVGGHGGMDFTMDYRLIYCLRNGLPLDQDVYDAAEWSCLTELTEYSVKNGSIPVEIPDFTRGAWQKINGLSFAQ